ncbi:MAG: YaaA family protein [Culicoidibacterales bacterium]
MIYFFLSPSKTMKLQHCHEIHSHPRFEAEAQQFRQYFRGLTEDELQKQLKISAKQAELVAHYYQTKQAFAAIDLYQGSVFQQLQPEAYTQEQRDYLQNHVMILSALYGCVRPFDGIQPYRLDLKQSLPILKQSLTSFWQERCLFEDGQPVMVNLASSEFAKLLPKTAITIDFVESYTNGKPKRLATYAKIARGQFLHQCIHEGVRTPAELKLLTTQRYHYSDVHSTAQHFVYLATT